MEYFLWRSGVLEDALNQTIVLKHAAIACFSFSPNGELNPHLIDLLPYSYPDKCRKLRVLRVPSGKAL